MQETEVGPPGSTPSSDEASAHSQVRTDNRGLQVEDYHDFVGALVTRLMRAMNLPFKMRDDFISAGMLGLVEAASRFDAGRGSDFRSFAFLRVRGAVIDYIRSSCDLTGKSYKMLKALEGAHELRMHEVADKRCRRPAGEARGAFAIDTLAKSAVVFALVRSSDDEGGLASQTPSDPEQECSKREISKKIRSLVATLPEKERTIIEQYYFHDRRLSEVAKEHSGLSKSWVSRLHDRALGILRDKLVENDIAEAF